MARTATLRASDADRETVAAKLHQAAVEGRLEPDELEERLHLALRARTYGDLRRLVADLPATPATWERRTSSVAPLAQAAFAVALRVAIVLVAVTAIVAVFAFTAAWWICWAVLWLALRGRRGHCGGHAAWRPPRARRI